MKSKIIILIIVIILITIILKIKNINNKNTEEIFFESKESTGIEDYIETLEDGTLKNKSEQLNKFKEIDDLEISNIRILGKNNETTILMDIKNKSKQIKVDKEVTLIMNDKNTNEIGKIGVNISELKSNEVMTIEIKTESNFINTCDFLIVDEALSLE